MDREYLIKQYANTILSNKDKEKTVLRVISEVDMLNIKLEEKSIILDSIADILDRKRLFLFEQQNYDYITMMRSASERLKKLEASAKSGK